MIYLVDENLTEHSHANLSLSILSHHTLEDVELVGLNLVDLSIGDLLSKIKRLYFRVTPKDIVLCPWAVPGSPSLDKAFDYLTDLCWVVCAAGNDSGDIAFWTPARCQNVITVGALNKNGKPAGLSNVSRTETKKLKWVTGTNYVSGSGSTSGTSVSACLYAAFLAEALRLKDGSLLQTLIDERKQTALAEL